MFLYSDSTRINSIIKTFNHTFAMKYCFIVIIVKYSTIPVTVDCTLCLIRTFL